MTPPCPVCGSTRTASAMSVREWQFARCRDCRSLFVVDPPPAAETEALYGGEAYYVDEGYAKDDAAYLGYKDYLADRVHIERKFSEALAHLERYVEPGRLLDVGAGPGFLLSAARQRGWDALGIDLNPWAAGYARDELGVEVRLAMLEDAAFPDASFDAVTMMDLIEHVATPDAIVAEAARITRRGGGLAILTPDAGSPVSRVLGGRWPEVKRAPEHVVLFSAAGLADLLERNGWRPVGWHSVGKTSSLETLLADVSPAAPGIAGPLRTLAERTRLGGLSFELDPRTKLCLYAVRDGGPRTTGRPPRLPKRPPTERSTEEAILEELESLAAARRLCDWMFEQFAGRAHGHAAEVGAGIGTFSDRLLRSGVERLLLIEPEPSCAAVLERRYAGDPRVELARDQLPESAALAEAAGELDFVLCQNVLEHIDDHGAAVRSMAAALRPGGHLGLLVPAHPRLYGALDAAYGHHRRYTPDLLRALLEEAGLVVEDLYRFNLLGVVGWWVKNRTGSSRIGPLALTAYEALVGVWRRLEDRRRPPAGLSLIAHARKP